MNVRLLLHPSRLRYLKVLLALFCFILRRRSIRSRMNIRIGLGTSSHHIYPKHPFLVLFASVATLSFPAQVYFLFAGGRCSSARFLGGRRCSCGLVGQGRASEGSIQIDRLLVLVCPLVFILFLFYLRLGCRPIVFIALSFYLKSSS